MEKSYIKIVPVSEKRRCVNSSFYTFTKRDDLILFKIITGVIEDGIDYQHQDEYEFWADSLENARSFLKTNIINLEKSGKISSLRYDAPDYTDAGFKKIVSCYISSPFDLQLYNNYDNLIHTLDHWWYCYRKLQELYGQLEEGKLINWVKN